MVTQALETRKKGLALALLCMAQFMVVLDFSIVNIALPSMQKDLGLSTQNLQWIISAYSLTFGGFLLLGGQTRFRGPINISNRGNPDPPEFASWRGRFDVGGNPVRIGS